MSASDERLEELLRALPPAPAHVVERALTLPDEAGEDVPGADYEPEHEPDIHSDPFGSADDTYGGSDDPSSGYDDPSAHDPYDDPL